MDDEMSDEIGKLFQKAMDDHMRKAFGVPAQSAPPPPLTIEHLHEMMDRLGTIYDRERGDMPGKVLVLNNDEHKGIITKIIVRNNRAWIKLFTETEPFEVSENINLYICDVPKREFKIKIDSPEYRTTDAILWGRFRLGL